MNTNNREDSAEKSTLHPRNRHRNRYDFERLTANYSPLTRYVKVNDYGDESIDFFNPRAVKALNKALLITHYEIKDWDIPRGYLCPPIPSRADYIHHMADLLAESNNNDIPKGAKIKGLDIGVGANCIYPIIAQTEYGWSFVGADIDSMAIINANNIAEANHPLRKHIECRLQQNANNKFRGIIEWNEHFDLVVCNPPFHASEEEALAGTSRKLRNLTKNKEVEVTTNFGGQAKELWTEGGERAFLISMIQESANFKSQCLWFSSLVSKESNLKAIYATLEKREAQEVKTIDLKHGNKVSRIVAWTFQSPTERQEWVQKFW